MGKTVLSVGFWIVGALVLIGSWRAGGWGLGVPVCTGLALGVAGLDVFRHRETLTWDWALVRTLLHLAAAVALASAVLFALAHLLVTGRFGFN
ncbi:hypothetical protein [Deferrisoma camini]|uniref:hypothetical protein n=1 Tax=Deferrisoma camini TaxID=1035120 RepID=UPI00046CC571|nr:hypothetical protein [Deferrisoma camini]